MRPRGVVPRARLPGVRLPVAGQEPGTRHPACSRPKSLAFAAPVGRVALVLGAWLVTPWIARLIVALAVCVLAYFMFTGR